MYDELVKRLKEDKSWVEQGTTQTEHEIAEHIQQAADAIDKLQKAVMRLEDESGILDELPMYQQPVGWIPVTERLPEAGERVLCYCRANIYEVMKMRTDGDWVYDTNHVYMHSFVTHWMPLPPAPKEE